MRICNTPAPQPITVHAFVALLSSPALIAIFVLIGIMVAIAIALGLYYFIIKRRPIKWRHPFCDDAEEKSVSEKV